MFSMESSCRRVETGKRHFIDEGEDVEDHDFLMSKSVHKQPNLLGI